MKVDIKTIPIPADVKRIKGDTLMLGEAWVPTRKVKCWVRRNGVMNADEALNYYSEQIQKEPTNPRLWLCRGLVWEVKDFSDRKSGIPSPIFLKRSDLIHNSQRRTCNVA